MNCLTKLGVLGVFLFCFVVFSESSMAELKSLGVHGNVESSEVYKNLLKQKTETDFTQKSNRELQLTIERLSNPKSFIESVLPVRSSVAKASLAPLSRESKIRDGNLCVVGADQKSIKWIAKHKDKIKASFQVCFITNISNISEYNRASEALGVPLFPIDFDDKKIVISVSQYPFVIQNGIMTNWEGVE